MAQNRNIKSSKLNSRRIARGYFVYILECADRSLYIGITTEVQRRLEEHKMGKGGNYTRSHGARKILYTEPFANRSLALKREASIKKLSRKRKLELIITPQASRGAQRISS